MTSNNKVLAPPNFENPITTPRGKYLSIQEASINNLKNISVELPHDTVVSVTGLSGSGKSSLVFDTIYAEGQRRYVETFSPYTRQFLDKIRKPPVLRIDGVRPTIAIHQRSRVHSARSTVGSLTNLHDYLKLLWANLSEASCISCNTPLPRWTTPRITIAIQKLVLLRDPQDTILICAPYLISSNSNLTEEIERLRVLGFSRFYNQTKKAICPLDDNEIIIYDSETASPLYIVFERIKGRSLAENRISEAVEHARQLGQNKVSLFVLNTTSLLESVHFENKNTCVSCHSENPSLAIPHPHLFTFSHPLGACPQCKGFGRLLEIDVNKCIPDPTLSIREGVIACWNGASASSEKKALIKFCSKTGISLDTPWSLLPKIQRDQILNENTRSFCGVLPWFEWLEKKTYKMHVRIFLARYRSPRICTTCNGTRFSQASMNYKLGNLKINEASDMPIGELENWLSTTFKSLKELPRDLKFVVKATLLKLQFLSKLGLNYLSLNRPSRTLSGGEMQRVNLAAALGTELTSMHFILDEPSIGLHHRDTNQLISVIQELSAKGNSITLVEHDLGVISSGEYVLELGPGSGSKGGSIINFSPTAEWQRPSIPNYSATHTTNIPSQKTPWLHIKNASARNLKNISVSIPLNTCCVLTGVSGSGKSTFVHEALVRAWEMSSNHRQQCNHKPITGVNVNLVEDLLAENKDDAPLITDPINHLSAIPIVEGFEHINELTVIDQNPLTKSPRANIATYTGLWDHYRTAFASSENAVSRALSRSSFSFNVEGGRCPNCKGAGATKESMQFLSDVIIACETCNGERFLPSVLSVTLDGKSVADILKTPVGECSFFFDRLPKIKATVELLCSLGLEHLTLGHSLSELSGGEAQRLKLVPFITSGSNNGHTLFIFDEPTTGLHLHDVSRLINVFRFLRDSGHSVLCVEHNLSLIDAFDWVIDFGPEGGSKGGYILAEGTPQELANRSDIATGLALSEWRNECIKMHKNHAKSSGEKVSLRSRHTDIRSIEIRGARAHNLKNIDVDVPLGKFIVFTGVSGSGKSTIAKDIIFAEGQRRYLDCLSPYARQFIKELSRPDVDSIKNLLPTIFVAQHTFQPSSLSTVGTLSETYHYLRLLFAKTGIQYCPEHPNTVISGSSSKDLIERLVAFDAPLRLLAPVIKNKKGHHKATILRAINSDIQEIRVDGIFCRPGSVAEGLSRHKAHTIEFVVAKIQNPRLSIDMLEQAINDGLALSNGELLVITSETEILLSTNRACPQCNRGFFSPDPEDFSFSSKRGRCKSCHGTGLTRTGKECGVCLGERISSAGRSVKLGDISIGYLSKFSAKNALGFIKDLTFTGRAQELATPIIKGITERLETLCNIGLEYLSLNRSCETLSGGELQRLRLSAALGSPLTGVLYLFDEPSAGLHPSDNTRVLAMLTKLRDSGNSVIMIEHDPTSILAADHVIDVGPGGGREGGEVICNASQSEFRRYTKSVTAKAICSYFNSLDNSLKTCSSNKEIAYSNNKINSEKISSVTVTTNGVGNVKKGNFYFPLNAITVISGVSGAGKSTLLYRIIRDTLKNCEKSIEKNSSIFEWNYKGNNISSPQKIERLIEVDQKPIGKNARSTPISYLKLFDDFRKLFSSTLDARAKGFDASFFSYNSGKGRCADCHGLGVCRLEMSFLAEAKVICDTCDGTRYSEQARAIKFAGLSIADLLKLTFTEAKTLFANHRKIHQKLRLTCELGLGYLTLGQDSSTLSGGESQRLKLVAELSASQRGHTLYLLDEPTTGLHISDVQCLIKTLRQLVNMGNTVVVIEHEEQVIITADYVIELGPGAAMNGGKMIFSGSPKSLLGSKTPWGEVLRSRYKENIKVA